VVDKQFQEQGVLSDGDVDGYVLLLPLDGEAEFNVASLMLARVGVERQRLVLAFNGCGLQQEKGSSDEVVLFIIVPENNIKSFCFGF